MSLNLTSKQTTIKLGPHKGEEIIWYASEACGRDISWDIYINVEKNTETMEQRTYTFSQSTLTVKFGNILDSQAKIIARLDDCHVAIGEGVSRAILGVGAALIPIQKVIGQMSIAIARNLANTNRSLNVEFYL